MNNKELKTLLIEDIKRSGLTEADIKKMKLQYFDDNKASIILNSTFCTYGYTLPYFDVKGNMIDTIRFRFLEDLEGKNKKIVKYSQPKGTEPRLYFPPCIKWSKILKDTSITLCFTEGEKKAYKASKMGIPTIGLGGVWSFKSKKLRKELIDDFKEIRLKDRKVLICFDNDLRSNEEVMKALHGFAKALYNEGAEPYNKLLPFNPYKKIGLDDYLIENSVKDFEALEEESFNEVTEVDELNNEVAYIHSTGKFYLFKSDLFVGSAQLKNDIFPNRKIMGDNGLPVSIAQLWLESIKRREHNKLTYQPAAPQVTEDNNYNLWKGWGCVPEKGNVKPFLNAVNTIFEGDKELIKWFLDWVAYPIQYPATKMLSAILLQSIEQGTGKSSLGLCIGSMYGENYNLIDDTQLHNVQFNEWAVNKQFILGDEISGKDKRSESDKIKNLITRPSISINRKYMPTYTVPDCINYFFTSNHPDALNIEPDDRRMFVYSIKAGKGLSLKQGQALEKFRAGKGKAYLLNYFINEYKISKGFDHRARPPMTQAKSDLIDHSLTDMERFLTHLKENVEFALSINGVPIDRDLFTTGQIAQMYGRINPKANVSTTAMGKALNKIFNESDQYTVKTLSGTHRLRALRNFDKWAKATHKQMQDHYDKSKIALFDATTKKKRKHS